MKCFKGATFVNKQATTPRLLQLARFFYLPSLYKICTLCQTVWFMPWLCFFHGRRWIQSKCHYHSFCVTLSSTVFAQAFVCRHWVSRFYRLALTRIRYVCVHSPVSHSSHSNLLIVLKAGKTFPSHKRNHIFIITSNKNGQMVWKAEWTFFA